MKKSKLFIITIAIITFLTLLSSCDSPGVYLLDEQLPNLTDPTTGYTYVTSAKVTEVSSGKTVELTEISEIEALRMNLEGIKCIREKDDGEEIPAYSIEFYAEDSKVFEMKVCDDDDYIIGEYHYEAMRSGVDMFYLGGLFKE